MPDSDQNNTPKRKDRADLVNETESEVYLDEPNESVDDKIDRQSIVDKVDNIAYTLFGNFFYKHKDSFSGLEDNMDESQMDIDNDLYLSRAFLYSLVSGVFGLLMGATVIIFLQVLGVLPQLDTGIRYPEPIAKTLWQLRPIIGAFVVGVIGYIIFTGISFGLAIYYPAYTAGVRKRRMKNTLPYAVTFMYALSRGGMGFNDVIDRVAESTGTYGEVAEEFQQIQTEMQLFSIDPPQAFRRASQRSSNEKFSDFCDDLRGTLDSGANITEFLGEKSKEYIRDTEQEQQSFLDFLELLGEMYVTALVAGPLFLIIILVILALLGGGSTVQLFAVVYLLVPFLNFGFFIFLETITSDDGHLSRTLKEWDTDQQTAAEVREQAEALDSDRLHEMADVKAKEEREEFIRNPLAKMKEEPKLSFVFSIPLAIITIAASLLTGAASPFISEFIRNPVVNTSLLFTIPFMITLLPYTLLYEAQSRRNAKIMSRFPSALSSLASANSIGLNLTESLETVANNSSGIMGEEFQTIKNKIVWENNVQAALAEFANRMRVRVITRTMKMVIEASEASGDVEEVLEIASRDVNKQHRLKEKQRQTMMMYTVVILMSFFVYLFVIVMLDSSFLSRVSGGEVGVDGPEVSGDAPGAGGQASEALSGGVGVNFDDVPVEQFRLVFFHSTLIQSIGSGLLAGQLMSNNIRKGLKFTLIQMTIASVVFFYITL